MTSRTDYPMNVLNNNEFKKLIAAIYVRVSTMKVSQKDSPEHQLSFNKEKADLEGFEVCDEYIYMDKGTGTNIIERPEIRRLIEDAKARKFQVVIFSSLSRFSRDTLDALSLKRILVDSIGIRLISLDENYDSAIDRDEFKFQIISAVNQKLSEQISISARRGIRESAKKGNNTASRAPFGYKKVNIKERKTLVPVEEEKEIVKLIFDLYVNHDLGEKRITEYLNSKGIPSPKGKKWGITTLQRILMNEAYVGRNVHGKYRVEKRYLDTNDLSKRKKVLTQQPKDKWMYANVPQTHELIIDEETFQKAQKIRLERGGGERGGIRNKVNIFAGIIKCQHCGASMVSMKSGKSSKEGNEYRYLICSTRRRVGEKGCENGFWLPYENFRDELLSELSNQLQNFTSVDGLFEHFKDEIQVDNEEFSKQVKKLEKEIENNRKMAFELRREKTSGLIDEAQYLFETEHLMKEIKQLETRLNDYNEKKQKKNDIESLYEEVKGALEDLLDLDIDSFDELHLTVKKLIENISVSNDGTIDVRSTFGLKIN